MHELSVAYSIVEMVEERAKKEGAEKVTRSEERRVGKDVL